MARIESSGFDDVMDALRKLGEDAAEVGGRMVEAGAAVVWDAWADSAEAHGHVDTGDMLASIGVAKPESSPGRIVREVYPQGKDRKGVRNATKAYVLNYGTSRRKATYWVRQAEDNAEDSAFDAMRGVWDEFIENGRA